MKTQVFLDCETTGGASPRIIELAMVTRVIGTRGKVHSRDSWVKLFNPQQRVNWFAYKVHGIHDRHLAYQDPIDKHLGFIAARLREADEVIAHSVSADRSPLEREFSRAGHRFPAVDWVCSLQLAREVISTVTLRRMPSSYKLPDLASHFKLRQDVAHRALPDALLCEAVFDRLHKLRKEKGR